MQDNSKQSPRWPQDDSRPDENKNRLLELGKVPGCLWLVMGALLIFWNILAFWPQTGTPTASISYSAFLDQIKAGNVVSVVIQGDQITGQFKQAINWPQPTPNPAATPGAVTTTSAASQNAYSAFQTTFPATVTDPSLMPLLVQHNVQVSVQQQSTPWWSVVLSLILNYLPFLLLIGFMIYMGRQAMQGQSGMFNFSRTKARRYGSGKGEHTRVTFQDVAGADEAKDNLQEVVGFLKNPDKYRKLGAHMPHGLLLVGPPGTGKTLLAKAVAGEAEVPFFSISASEFVEMFVGVGASRVRDLFDKAREAAPAIVFIDELDAVGRRRGAGLGNVNDEREQTLNQLLVAIDGFEENTAVIVLAATNRPDVLDPALLRPGRFDRQVIMELPDRPGREAILRIHSKGLPLAAEIDLAALARNTTGLSGADLANLCNEAALQAARHDHFEITGGDFEEALDKVILGDKRNVMMTPLDRRIVAYHESGHAMVGWLMPQADPVRRVTVIPHGKALGATEQRPAEDRYNFSRSYLMSRLAVLLGGRASEELVFGEVTTGAENDLVEATKLVRRMVTEWGMSAVGLTALENNAEQPFLGYELAQGRHYSEVMAARVDEEINNMLDERYKSARQLLVENRAKLDNLVEILLQEDTVYLERLEIILGPRPEEATGPLSGEAARTPTAGALNY